MEKLYFVHNAVLNFIILLLLSHDIEGRNMINCCIRSKTEKEESQITQVNNPIYRNQSKDKKNTRSLDSKDTMETSTISSDSSESYLIKSTTLDNINQFINDQVNLPQNRRALLLERYLTEDEKIKHNIVNET